MKSCDQEPALALPTWDQCRQPPFPSSPSLSLTTEIWVLMWGMVGGEHPHDILRCSMVVALIVPGGSLVGGQQALSPGISLTPTFPSRYWVCCGVQFGSKWCEDVRFLLGVAAEINNHNGLYHQISLQFKSCHDWGTGKLNHWPEIR